MGDMEQRGRQLVHRLRQLGRGAPEPAKTGSDTGSDTGKSAGSDAPSAPSGAQHFLHQTYARDNGDVAEAYGSEDSAALRRHFEQYGRHETRGIRQEDFFRVEGVLGCDQGYLFLTGWADRRVMKEINLSVEIGYLRHDLGALEPCWYFRGDVAGQTGDRGQPSAFMLMLPLPDFGLHPRVRILVNGLVVHEQTSLRWRSVDVFLTETLSSAAVLADQQIGSSIDAADRLLPAFQTLWSRFLSQLTFAQSYAHGQDRPVSQSIIIAIYKDASMLLPQLETLAATLSGQPIEVIVVGNDLKEAPKLAAQLRGFCQIHDVALRLYLCSGNSGFSAANNFGADMARGEVLIFMNPDIFPPEAEAAPSLGFLSRDPGPGLVGALLYYGDGLLMHSGMYVASDLAVDVRHGRSEPVLRVEHFGKGLGARIDDDSAALEPIMAPIRDRKLLVTAALWKIRKSVFVEMGGLSTDYLFAYYEDADFCMRALEAELPVSLDEEARWIHMEGVGKANPPFVRSFMWLNRVLFTRRFVGSELVASDDIDLYQL